MAALLRVLRPCAQAWAYETVLTSLAPLPWRRFDPASSSGSVSCSMTRVGAAPTQSTLIRLSGRIEQVLEALFRCPRPATSKKLAAALLAWRASTDLLQHGKRTTTTLRHCGSPSQPRRGTGTGENKQNSRAAKAESRDRRGARSARGACHDPKTTDPRALRRLQRARRPRRLRFAG